jgi:hypothetical protein
MEFLVDLPTIEVPSTDFEIAAGWFCLLPIYILAGIWLLRLILSCFIRPRRSLIPWVIFFWR